jgi:CDGSH-type Zn-finger protein
MGVSVKVYRNGPYEIAGPVEVVDFEGKIYQRPDDPVYLCRCGQSADKPFCDGTHKKAGFRAEECVRLKG